MIKIIILIFYLDIKKYCKFTYLKKSSFERHLEIDLEWVWQVSVEVHFENFVTIVKIWEEIFFLQNILNRKKYYIILKNIYKELFLILNHLKGWRKKKKILENKTKNYYNNLFWFKNILYLGYCYNVICVLSADQYLEHMEQGSHGCMSSKMVNRERYGLMAIKLHNHLHSFSLFINHFLYTRI